MIDLRSDTVTRPTPPMRRAIAEAEVGDDVFGDDPSVRLLEEAAAERLGKEAGLFVPSGTMANQIAIRTHTRPGDAVIVGRNAHAYLAEGGGIAALSGATPVIVGEDGFFDGDDVRAHVYPDDPHFARTRLVCVENTHNVSGGRVFPLERIQGVAAAARTAGLRLHLDGARLFNAEIATGVPVATWADPFDSVSFCLSKGLGAPVGSLVVGSREFVQQAHRCRKLLGGAMRQAGVLAAAGLFALEHHVKRLEQDHRHARLLAEGLREIQAVHDLVEPETNMVFFRVPDREAFLRDARERGLLLGGSIRAVTHLDVTAADVASAVEIIREVLA